MVPAAAGDPIDRICPLAGPNEAMAFEAQMEEWSADPEASWPVEKAAERMRMILYGVWRSITTPDVRRPRGPSGRRSTLLTSPSMEESSRRESLYLRERSQNSAWGRQELQTRSRFPDASASSGSSRSVS